MAISFNHSSLYANPGLSFSPLPGFKVGYATSITISLSNTGATTRNVIIHLWWAGPTMPSSPGPMIDLVSTNRLAPPYGSTHPIFFSVAAGGVGSATVSWTPSAADFPSATLGASVPGFIFAQAEIQALPPTLPGDTSALNNWCPAYALCAQYNIQIAT